MGLQLGLLVVGGEARSRGARRSRRRPCRGCCRRRRRWRRRRSAAPSPRAPPPSPARCRRRWPPTSPGAAWPGSRPRRSPPRGSPRRSPPCRRGSPLSSPRSPATSSQPSSPQLRRLLGVADEADDLVAAVAQLAHDLAADEAGSSGHEDLHGRQPYPARAAAYNQPECNVREMAAIRRRATARSGTAPASRTRARASGRWRSASSTGASEGEPLAELKELLRTAGVATAGERDPAAPEARPRPLLRPRPAGRAESGDRRLRRQPGRLRRRAGAAPGAQPRGGARRAGDRPHRGDPRHLRRPRPLGRGQAAGRAGPARIQHGPHAGALDPPRAPRRRPHGRRHRHQGPGRDPDRDRPPPRPRPDRGAAPPARAAGAQPRRDARPARELLAAAGRPRRLHQRRQVDAAERPHRGRGRGRRPALPHPRPDHPQPSSSPAATTC